MYDTKVVKSPLVKKYFCVYCNYTCSRISDWKKHTLTAKHKKNVVFSNTSNTSKIRQDRWCCECGKEFKHRGSLYNHKKKCAKIAKIAEIAEEEKEENEEVTIKKNDDPDYKNLLIQAMKQIQKKDDLVSEAMKEMTEMRKEMTEMRKENTKLIPLIGNNNNNTTNNFNLNLFLNEKCKDALNLTDFVNSLKVQLTDLEYTAENGHIAGITNIFHNALSNLEETKRPLHCTDLKREVLYIKDNNEWHKDENKEEIKVAVNKVVNKNIGNQAKWIDAHPNLNDETEMEKYIKMQDHSLGTGQEIEKNKIVKNIMKEVIIQK